MSTPSNGVLRVVCTTMLHPAGHRHIIAIGTGDNLGQPTKMWTVDEAWAAMQAKPGVWFYTQDNAGHTAWVGREDCEACGLKTLRSFPDATTENNLASLPDCN